MIEGFRSIKETATEWNISTRRLQVLCSQGRIEGAAKLGREWAVPTSAIKPPDERITTGQYKDWRKKTNK